MKLHYAAPALMAGLLFFALTGLRAEDKPMTAPSGAPAVAPVAAQEAPQGGVEVMRLVLTTSLQEREPGPEITTAKVGDTVIAWTQIRSGLGEVNVTHRWLHEVENAGDVSLAVKSSPWRTWSRKTVSEPGNWKVQVLDPSGKVLKEVAFTVTP